MIDRLLRDLMQQLDQPRLDIEKNVRALLQEWIASQQLVTRDELERQQLALARTRGQLDVLQERLSWLEQQAIGPAATDSTVPDQLAAGLPAAATPTAVTTSSETAGLPVAKAASLGSGPAASPVNADTALLTPATPDQHAMADTPAGPVSAATTADTASKGSE